MGGDAFVNVRDWSLGSGTSVAEVVQHLEGSRLLAGFAVSPNGLAPRLWRGFATHKSGSPPDRGHAMLGCYLGARARSAS